MFKNIVHKLRMLTGTIFLNSQVKDVKIIGYDKAGYKLEITRKKPLIVKTKKKDILLRRGEVEGSFKLDITADELYDYIKNSKDEGYKVLYFNIDVGGGKQNMLIPIKFADMMLEQIDRLKVRSLIIDAEHDKEMEEKGYYVMPQMEG